MFVKDIVRDAAFVFFVTYWGGVIFSPESVAGSAVPFILFNYLCAFLGFYFVAHWTKALSLAGQLSHLAVVAGIVWLSSLPQVLQLAAGTTSWMLSILMLMAMVLISIGTNRIFKS